jgi:hypothetical protein
VSEFFRRFDGGVGISSTDSAIVVIVAGSKRTNKGLLMEHAG